MGKLRVVALSTLVAVSAAALTAASCSSSSSTNQNNGNGDGGSGSGQGTGGNSFTQPIGPAGASITNSSSGFSVTVPPGALASTVNVEVSVLTSSSSYPSSMPTLPSGWTLQSYVYELQPSNQQFKKAVVVELPYTGASGSQVVSAEPSGTWGVVSGAMFGSTLATFETTHFSFYAVVTMGGGGGSGSGGSGSGTSSGSGSGSSSAMPCGEGCSNSAGSCVGGVCMCPTGYSTCDNICVNEQLDVMNCGGCGIACAESCISGECQVTLSSSESAVALAVDASALYWVNSSGSVVSIPLSGGSTTTLATGQNSPLAIALDGSNVYWTTTDGNIVAVGKSGGTPKTILTGQGGIVGLAVASGEAFWGAQADGINYQIRGTTLPAGGATIVIAETDGAAYGIAADATNVYWSTKAALYSAPISGGTMTALDAGGPPATRLASVGATTGSTGSAPVVALAIDSSDIYWGTFGATAAGPGGTGTGTVQKIGLTGSGEQGLASGQSGPNGLAIDDKSIYWTTGLGLVLKLPLGGGTPSTLASTSNGGTGIVVDGTTVYWGSGNTVQKITPK